MAEYRAALLRVLLLTALLGVAACVTTNQPRSAVEERAAVLVTQNCVLVQEGDSGEPQRKDKVDTSQVTINSLIVGDNGWVRIAFAASGLVDSLYYFTRFGRRICGTRAWTKRGMSFQAVPGVVTLNDLGGA